MAAPPLPKRGLTSLIGGAATGLCVLGLWLAIEYDVGAVSALNTRFGIFVAVAVAIWVRVADL